MLNRVRIVEYRCLREVDVPLKPLTVLIGPNNSGKTAFLSAIQLLGRIGSQAQHQHTAIDVTDLWRFEKSSCPVISGFTAGGIEIRVERGPTKQPPDQRHQWTASGKTFEIVPINLFDSGLLPAMASLGADAKSGIPRIDDKVTNVPAYLDVLLRKDRERFFRVRDTLRRLIPGLSDLNIETPSAQSRRIDLVFEDGLTMDAANASYGVKLMIFFVALANHPNPPRTILLEEPESGVHPKRLEDIVRLLIGLTCGEFAEQKTQVIVTTHSPYLLDCVDPIKHQVLVMQRESDGACVARQIDTNRLKSFLTEFMLGEVWLNQEEAGLIEKVG